MAPPPEPAAKPAHVNPESRPGPADAHRAATFEQELANLQQQARDIFQKEMDLQCSAKSDPLHIARMPDAKRTYDEENRLESISSTFPGQKQVEYKESFVPNGSEAVLRGFEVFDVNGNTIAKGSFSPDPATGEPHLDQSMQWIKKDGVYEKIEARFGHDSKIRRITQFELKVDDHHRVVGASPISSEIQTADSHSVISDFYNRNGVRLSRTEETQAGKKVYSLNPPGADNKQSVLAIDVFDPKGERKQEILYHRHTNGTGLLGITKDVVNYPKGYNLPARSIFESDKSPKTIRDLNVELGDETSLEVPKYNFKDVP